MCRLPTSTTALQRAPAPIELPPSSRATSQSYAPKLGVERSDCSFMG
jgi:hypothetical protein